MANEVSMARVRLVLCGYLSERMVERVMVELGAAPAPARMSSAVASKLAEQIRKNADND